MRRLALALVGAMLVAGCSSGATASPIGASLKPSPSDILAPTEAPTATAEATPEPVATEEPTPAPSVAVKKYKVKKGDTFTKIAKKYKITVEALQAANPKVKATALKVGQTLIIPQP